MYEVALTREAERSYSAVDRALAQKLARCFSRLAIDPRLGNNVKPLSGPLAGMFRYRVGEYRVVYTIDDALKRVVVITIAHRGDVYR